MKNILTVAGISLAVIIVDKMFGLSAKVTGK